MSKYGVVIGRFQVSDLHVGHRLLLDTVKQLHPTLIVLIGVHGAGQPTIKNPLDYLTRAAMIRSAYPEAMIRPLYDQASNEAWSHSVDDLICAHPTEGAVIYGGRDASALTCYTGAWPTQNLDFGISAVSGTNQRQDILMRETADFRAGVIYATQRQFPKVFSTVDIAVVRHRYWSPETVGITSEVLVGQKSTDGGLFRFPGGFVDPSDASLQAAAQRELQEETNLTIEPSNDEWTYIGHTKLNDWRYRHEEDAVITHLFKVQYDATVHGTPCAGDDLAHVEWKPLMTLRDQLIETHKPVYDLLVRPY